MSLIHVLLLRFCVAETATQLPSDKTMSSLDFLFSLLLQSPLNYAMFSSRLKRNLSVLKTAKHSCWIPHTSLNFDSGAIEYTLILFAPHKVNGSHPDGLIVRAGEQLWAIGRKLDPLHPAQVSATVRHLLIALQVPQLQINNKSFLTYFQKQFNCPSKRARSKSKRHTRLIW